MSRRLGWGLKPARLLPVMLGLVALIGPHGVAEAGYFECRLVGRDGSWRIVQQDLAQRFPTLVGECRPVVLPPAAAADSGDDPDADSDTGLADVAEPTSVRVISARAPVRRAAAVWRAPQAWDVLIAQAADRHEVDRRLVRAVIQVESAFAPNARSPKGAIGLMQLMPATGLRFGAPSVESLRDPAVNVDVGVRYLRKLLDLFGERVELALAAYNAGEGAVMRHGYRVPPYRETQDYVRKVRGLYEGVE